jgi:hypothetical protein
MINFSIIEDEDLDFAFEFTVLINEKYEYGIEADTEEDALAVAKEFFTDDYPEVEIITIEIIDATEI